MNNSIIPIVPNPNHTLMKNIYSLLVLAATLLASCTEERVYPEVNKLNISQSLFTEFDPAVVLTVEAADRVSFVDVTLPNTPVYRNDTLVRVTEAKSLDPIAMSNGKGSTTVNRNDFNWVTAPGQSQLVRLNTNGSDYDFYHFPVVLTSALQVSAPEKMGVSEEKEIKGTVKTGTPGIVSTVTARLKKGSTGDYTAITLDENGVFVLKGADLDAGSDYFIQFTAASGSTIVTKEVKVTVE